MIINLFSGKFSHSFEISIDRRCKVNSFRRVIYPELKHPIWWKGLLINKINIFCDENTIHVWKSDPNQLLTKPTTKKFPTSSKNIETEQEEEKNGVLYLNEGLLSRGQISEIKDLLVSLKEKSADDYYELDLRLLKLVYCYILPSYKLLRVDLNSLHKCLSLVKNEILQMDEEIIKHEIKIYHRKFDIKLKEKRSLFRCLTWPEINTIIVKTLNEKFLETIIFHLREDCVSLEELYCKRRKQVRCLKEKKQETLDINEQIDLFSLEEEANNICQELLDLKMLIFKLDNFERSGVGESTLKEFKLLRKFSQDYMEIYQHLVRLKKNSCSEKLRLTTIVRCVRLTIENVETFGESQNLNGENNCEEELKFLGIVWESALRRWRNCEEKVKCLLFDNDVKDGPMDVHFEFKEQLSMKISSGISELSEETLSIEEEIENKDVDIQPMSWSLHSLSDESIDIMKPLSEKWSRLVDLIKSEISEHIFEMSKIIMSSEIFDPSELEEIPWIYEKLLLTEMAENIINLFEVALNNQCQEFCRRVQLLCCFPVPKYMFNSIGSTKVSKKVYMEKQKGNNVYYEREAFKSEESFRILADNSKSKHDKDWVSLLLEKTSSKESKRTGCVCSESRGKSTPSSNKTTNSERGEIAFEEKAKTNDYVYDDDLSDDEDDPDDNMEFLSHQNIGKFCLYFHSSMKSIERFLSAKSLHEKLENMVLTLKCISFALANMKQSSRSRSRSGSSSSISSSNSDGFNVTVDDIVNVLSALLYSLPEKQLKKLFYDLYFIDAFMPKKYRSEFRGNALVHFQCSLEIISVECCRRIKQKQYS